MAQHASAALARRPLLVFSRDNFDDFWTALLADVRADDIADQVYTGSLQHPLVQYQWAHQQYLAHLGIPLLAPEEFSRDPMGLYDNFISQVYRNNAAMPNPTDPPLPDAADLQEAWATYRQGQRTLFSRAVATLRVGTSMHYARAVPFGAGTRLLATILSDNRRNTTTSLMAVFSSLLTLRLGASETFSSISNRVDLMISRLRGWVPPIVLPGQLTLCCLLTALPESPYGPIRHIILARPNITYEDGTRMLRDVAQSAASFSAPRTPTSSAVMAAAATPAIFTQSDVAAMVATTIAAAQAKDKKKRRGTDLFHIHGACKNHGPDSLHATMECNDPTLSKRRTTPDAAANYASVLVTHITAGYSTPLGAPGPPASTVSLDTTVTPPTAASPPRPTRTHEAHGGYLADGESDSDDDSCPLGALWADDWADDPDEPVRHLRAAVTSPATHNPVGPGVSTSVHARQTSFHGHGPADPDKDTSSCPELLSESDYHDDSRPPAHVYTLRVGRTDVTVLDSGASRHITATSPARVSACPPVNVNGIAGAPVRVAAATTLDNCHDILVVPGANASVRSVGCLLDARAGTIIFDERAAYFSRMPPPSVRTQIALRAPTGLYVVLPDTIAPPDRAADATVNLSVAGQVRREQVHELHRLLGHAGVAVMRQVLATCPPPTSGLRPADVRLFTSCAACRLGDAKRAPAPRSTANRATAFAYRLHADTSGRIRPPTPSGASYAQVCVDDASRWIFVRLLSTMAMGTAAAALESVFRDAASGESVLPTKILRTDNGTEYLNSAVSALLASANISRERTCPHTSHQNGVAERAIGIVFAKARTMLIDACLPPQYWGEALVTAAYIRNRLPCSSNPGGVSPYEARHGRLPDLRRLRPFGITAFVRDANPASKVHPRAVAGVFLGYSDDLTNQKGYRVLLPHGKLVTSNDVTFAATLGDSVARRRPHLVSSNMPLIDAAPTCPPDLLTPAPHGVMPDAEAPAAPPATRSHTAAACILTPPTTVADTTTDLVGRRVTKRFAGVSHTGTVIDVDTDTATGNKIFGVRYADGDREDYTHAELAPLVHALVSDAHPEFAAYWKEAAADADLASNHHTPATYAEAISGADQAHWIASIADELQSLVDHEVYQIIPRAAMPPGSTTIKTKWVFKVKQDASGCVTRYKSRLTACGYAQRHGRDYSETFSPVASATAIRAVFLTAAHRGLHLRQYDCKTAFLYGRLPADQRVYIHIPMGMTAPPHSVAALYRSLYGLKQACRLFNEHINAALTHLGFHASSSDPCLYILDHGGVYATCALVVDDLLLATDSPDFAEQFQDTLAKTYELSVLGEPTWMIGLRVTRSGPAISLSQERYVSDIAARFGQSDCRPVHTPADHSLELAATTGQPLNPDTHDYLSLIGSLMWCTITRPDVSTIVSALAQYTAAPTETHWRAGIRVVRYLFHSRHLGIVYDGTLLGDNPIPSGHADSSWGNERKGRSRYGYVAGLGDNYVTWKSRVSSMVCLSTAEAEFFAATECTKELIWLRGLFAELGYNMTGPSIVAEDNQACLKMITNPSISGRNRHFAMRMHWLREQSAKGTVSFKYVPSSEQRADIFTKTLPSAAFLVQRDHLVQDTHLLPPKPD